MIKLFTHRDDPDGLGSVVLTKLLTRDLDFTLCKNISELDQFLEEFINKKEFQKYSQILITDLCPSDSILQRIDQDSDLALKFHVFDHHQTSIDKMTAEYSFVTSYVKKDGIPCCGTSLYYDYLVRTTKDELLKKKIVMQFVEKTRLHDTWEWKKLDDKDSFYLQTLFQFLGSYGYYYHFLEKLQREESMEYTLEEKKWIQMQEFTNTQQIKELASHVFVDSYQDYQVGMVFGSYALRNDLAEYLRQERPDLDILMLFAMDNQSVSFRALKENVEVRSLAEKYPGGGGHEKAAACPWSSLEPILLKRVLK